MKVTILGGGIAGITTGIVLRLAGFETEIISDSFNYGQEYQKKRPIFPTNIAAASIVPHSVKLNTTQPILENSQKIFDILKSSNKYGVRQELHFEVFEFPVDPPEYSKSVQSFHMIAPDNYPENVPQLSDLSVYGWYFDMFFAEMPIYLKCLYELYEKIGGKKTKLKLDKKTVQEIETNLIVNCLGLGSLEIFPDSAPIQVVRGINVRVKVPETVTKNASFTSYNYTPNKETYSMPESTADVYCYMRKDGWILGSTRENGKLIKGEWVGNAYSGPFVDIDGIKVPEPIITLNQKLINSISGIDISKYELEPLVGYRFVRDPIRLEKTSEFGKIVVHHYGTGGSGITLSWGLAIEVLRLLSKNPDWLDVSKFGLDELNEIQKVLH